MLTYSYSFYC